MELKDYIKRYVRYGVVKDEWEFAEICSLTMEVARALYPYEFDKKLEVLEESSVEMLKRFNIGFCEGCLFQNVFVIMRLIHCGFENDEIAKILGVKNGLVVEIREEFELRRRTN